MPSVISGDANVSATEFGYLDGVTSALQTQVDSKLPIAGGKVLQVVSADTNSSFSTSSTSYIDWTGVTLSITPSSASSKVYVLLSMPAFSNGSANLAVLAQIVRDSTVIFGRSVGVSSASNHGLSANIAFVDSPNTTSATTYKAQVSVNGGTGNIERGSIIAMEVSA
jgi:hypothetical protein